MQREPISLSDAQLSLITQLAEPLAPPDRSAFLAALANLFRQEPTQPVGDGVLHRHARASGSYRRQDTLAVGTASARHQGATGATAGKRSKLLARAAIK
jgi:hypothetical protein